MIPNSPGLKKRGEKVGEKNAAADLSERHNWKKVEEKERKERKGTKDLK